MRKMFICSLFLAIAAVCFAAPVENVISFQGKIVEGGTPVDGARNITFRLYDVAVGGTHLWEETHIGVPVVGGLFNRELGATVTFEFEGVDFSEQYWIGISVGGGAELTPRYKLTSSPYAMNSVWEINGSDIYYDDGNVGIGTTTPAYPLQVVGSVSGLAADGDGLGHFENTATTNDAAGVYGECAATANWGYGGYFKGGYRGVHGIADVAGTGYRYGVYGLGADGSSSNYGVYGAASGGTASYGVYGTATGATTNWAGYFSGNVHITGDLTVDGSYPGGGGSDNDWAYSSGSGLTGDIYHTGAVGIGLSTAPSALLHLYDSGVADIDLENTTGTWRITHPSSGNLHFHKVADVSNVLVLEETTGYVGINTTDPDERLHIYGASNTYVHLESDAYAFFQADGGGTANSGFSFYNDGVATGLIWWTPIDEQIRFSAGDHGGAEMVLTTQSRLGIGETSPDAGIHLTGSSYPETFIICETGSGQDAGIRFHEGADDKWHVLFEGSTEDFEIRNGDYEPHFTINQSNGYVGIGTTAPSAMMTISTTLTGISGGLNLNRGSDDWYIYQDAAEGLAFRDDASDAMVIDSAGRVGINETSPELPLHIKQMTSSADGIRIEENSTTDYWDLGIASTENFWFEYNGSLEAWIDHTDGTYNAVSDRRLKTEIEPMEPVLDKIARLEPVNYYFKNDTERDHKSMGFIAQEVAEVFPTVAPFEEDFGFYGINYSYLTVLTLKGLIELNQEYQSTIENQETRLETLESQIELLKAEIEQLKEAK